MMKHLTYFFIIAIVVILSGCATISGPYCPYSREFSLVTTPKDSPKKSYEKVKKDTVSAIAKQRAMIANDPNNGALFGQLSYLLTENEQYDEAITAAKRAIELTGEWWFEALGFAYQGKGQYDDALKAYKKVTAIGPSGLNYCRLGETYMKKMDYAAAARAFRKASELESKNDNYQMKMALACYHMGKYDSALSSIDKAINIKNNGMMGMRIKIEGIARASWNYRTDKWNDDEVAPKTCDVIEVGKDSPADKAGLKVGDKLIAIDEISLLDPAVAKSSKDFFENYIKAKAPGTPVEIFRQGKKKSTTVILGRLNDTYLPVKLGIKSMLLARLVKNDKAVKCVNEALNSKQANKNSDGWAKAALGKISLDNDRYAEAIKRFSDVKNSTTARVLEATAYAKKGDFNKAVEIYTAIPEEKLTPKDVPLWSDRTALLKTLKPFISSKMESAGSLRAQGRSKEALKELGDALKVSDDQESKKILSTISAIMEMDPKLSELPEEARKYALMGDMLTKQGKFADAAKEYRKAVQAAPYIARLYFNTAMIYGELKRYPQAIRHMKTYLNLAPEAPNARAAKDQIYRWEFMMGKGNN